MNYVITNQAVNIQQGHFLNTSLVYGVPDKVCVLVKSVTRYCEHVKVCERYCNYVHTSRVRAKLIDTYSTHVCSL
jgi:hypothetical protein